jgi:hypothetical protein
VDKRPSVLFPSLGMDRGNRPHGLLWMEAAVDSLVGGSLRSQNVLIRNDSAAPRRVFIWRAVVNWWARLGARKKIVWRNLVPAARSRRLALGSVCLLRSGGQDQSPGLPCGSLRVGAYGGVWRLSLDRSACGQDGSGAGILGNILGPNRDMPLSTVREGPALAKAQTLFTLIVVKIGT